MRHLGRKVGRGFPRARQHQDHRKHADDLRQQTTQLLRGRPPRPPFDIDPRAILVLELNRPVERHEWQAAGLGVLDDSETTALVAVSESSDLAKFAERLARHREATVSEKGHVFAGALFDAVESIRWYGPEDRVGSSLEEASAEAEVRDMDVEVWHPGGQDTAATWLALVREAIVQADGVVVDARIDGESRVILVRVRLSPVAALALARVDEVATIDLAPAVHLPHRELVDFEVASMQSPHPAPPGSPLIAVIDSGVSGAHPLLADALYEATTLLPELVDGSDEHGHGTGVAGVALYGPAETWIDELIDTGRTPVPVGRLLSIRVLDHRNEFPTNMAWGHAVVEAVEYAARAGATIVNLSVGNLEGAQITRRSTPVASMLDTVARNLGVVLVIPTGNSEDGLDELSADDLPERAYLQRLVSGKGRTMLDPAPAALALTVGGTAGRIERSPLLERVLGTGDAPSAVTRRGPGTSRAIKPELVAPAGTRAWSSTLGVVNRLSLLGQPLLSNRPDALFGRDVGTSYAAPAVANVAAGVLAAHPSASSRLIRALVLQSSRVAAPGLEEVMPGPKPADRRRQYLHLLGHGTPERTRAAFSTASRVVLTAEIKLAVDSVVVYEVPIPSAFFGSGGRRTLDLAIAFDPLTRHRRKDYLATRLFAYVIAGRSVGEILDVLGEATEEELEAPIDEHEASDTAISDGALRPKLADLKPWVLSPSAPASSDCANSLRRWVRKTRLEPGVGDTAYLAIRTTSRWAPEGREDPIAIAMALGYEGLEQVDLHAELRARLEVPTQIEVDA